MPRKGMSVVPSFHPKTTPFHSTPTSFSDSTVAEIIETAAAAITKWNILDPSAPTRFTSLFHESRPEAYRFVSSVSDLQKLMTFLVNSGDFQFPEKLAQCQTLMQIAMKRLENELFQILSANRARPDPESVSVSPRASTTSSSDLRGGDDDARSESVGEELDSVSVSVTETATSDLRAIAECMFSCGYGKECVRLYQMTRKSIIDEAIYRLGIERSSRSKFNKLRWDAIDLKITKWLRAVRVATSWLFAGERLLCDRVFGFSGTARESSCFSEIAGNGADLLFRFPELVAKSKKSSPEKTFRVFDMYVAISDRLPEIEVIFDDSVRSRAGAAMLRLGQSVQALVSELERSIERHSPRSPVPATGGVHDLTVRVTSFLTLLADYGHVITEIFPEQPSPECHSGDTESQSPANTCARFSSLILVLLCKLDELAKQYKHVSLSYLFLANNLCHVVYRARTSDLQFLLGEHWIEEHEAKARQFAGSYERFMWSPVLTSLQPGDDPTATAPSSPFTRFNSVFEDTCRRQGAWVVVWDPNLREQIAGSIRSNLVPAYRELYERHEKDVIAKYAPEELENALSELFLGEDRTDLSSPVDGQRKLWGRH